MGCARAGREGCFIGHTEGYVKKAVETGVFLRRGLVGGPGEVSINQEALLIGESERYAKKKGSEKWQLSP